VGEIELPAVHKTVRHLRLAGAGVKAENPSGA
jgi:hypothetical protein